MSEPEPHWQPAVSVGAIGGRPSALDAVKVTAAKAMLTSGTMTASEVARQVGCSASTLYRHALTSAAASNRASGECTYLLLIECVLWPSKLARVGSL